MGSNELLEKHSHLEWQQGCPNGQCSGQWRRIKYSKCASKSFCVKPACIVNSYIVSNWLARERGYRPCDQGTERAARHSYLGAKLIVGTIAADNDVFDHDSGFCAEFIYLVCSRTWTCLHCPAQVLSRNACSLAAVMPPFRATGAKQVFARPAGSAPPLSFQMGLSICSRSIR